MREDKAMKKDSIKVYIKEPGRPLRQQTVKNTLEELQSLVGGYIEFVPLWREQGRGFLVNEEGKLRGLDVNFWYGDDYICGPAVFLGVKGENFVDCPIEFRAFAAIFDNLFPPVHDHD